MNNTQKTGIAAALLLVCGSALAAHDLQAADILRASYQTRMAVLWICAAIALAVFAVMIYSIVMFRKSRGAAPDGFDRSTVAEVLWATIAIMILVGAVVPAVKQVVMTAATPDSQANSGV